MWQLGPPDGRLNVSDPDGNPLTITLAVPNPNPNFTSGGTTVAWTVSADGKTLIGLYLGATAATSAFGAAGSLVVVVVWVYYSSWILFFGAEVTREFALRHGTLRPRSPA